MRYLSKLPALVFVVFAFLVSCKEEDPAPVTPIVYDTADLITRNFVTVDAAFDWAINGDVISDGLEYSFGSKSEFEWNADSSVVELSVFATGTANSLFTSEVTVEKDKSYFSALVGPASNGLVLWNENDETLPAADNVRIRFMHAYPASGPVDIYVGGTDPEHKVVDGLEYAFLSGYIEASETDLNASLICTEKGVAPDPDTNLFTITNSTNNHVKGKIYIDILASATTDPLSEFSLFISEQ